MVTKKEKFFELFKDGKWHTRKDICDQLGLVGNDPRTSMGWYFIHFVRSGHLERARMPDEIKAQMPTYENVRHYVYRWTGKPFVLRKNTNKYTYEKKDGANSPTNPTNKV